jgi:hypothetical protein
MPIRTAVKSAEIKACRPAHNIRHTAGRALTHRRRFFRRTPTRPQATERLARPAGLEPATYCLEGSCSVRLSYGRPTMRWPARRGADEPLAPGNASPPRQLTPVPAHSQREPVFGDPQQRPPSETPASSTRRHVGRAALSVNVPVRRDCRRFGSRRTSRRANLSAVARHLANGADNGRAKCIFSVPMVENRGNTAPLARDPWKVLA